MYIASHKNFENEVSATQSGNFYSEQEKIFIEDGKKFHSHFQQ